MTPIHRLCLAAAWATLAAPVAAQVPPATAGPVRDAYINMRGAEIADVAEQVSRLTGRTLILDPNVRGTVNVVSAEPLSPDGVWELFRSVLRVHGFAAVRSGRAWRIVPQATAVQSGGGLTAGAPRAADVVTRLVRLRNLPSETAARVLKPLVASFGSLEALPSPNAIVITDYADNVRRIEALARSLDGGTGTGFEAITLRFAGAAEVGEAIGRILGEGGQAGGPRTAVDQRSNIVLVRGDATAIAEARRIAAALDKPGGTTVTRVIRLRNSDAESVTEILRGLMGEPGEGSNPVARSLAEPRARTRAGSATRSEATLSAPVAQPAMPPNGGTTASSAVSINAPPSGFSTGDVAIQPAIGINGIVVRGSPAAIAAIDALISELDVRRPQVMIEAAIVEVTADVAEQLGVQLALGAAVPLDGSSAATSFSTLGLSIRDILRSLGEPAAIGLLGDGLSAGVAERNDFAVLVQALGQSSKANLLSTPSLTTLDNQPAEIVVGQNVPFRTGAFTTDGNITNPFTTIEREDVGITLRVVPRVHSGDVVRLEVSQEASSLVNANVVGAADLITNRRSIQTTVLADDGGTVVLGGLITDDRLSSRSKVPLLGDIPVVGELFRSRREGQTKRTLFVFLRPTILRDQAATATAAQAKYARLREHEMVLDTDRSLLLAPPPKRLSVEIEGIY